MARLVLVHDGVNLRDYKLDKDKISLGRKPENDIQIDDGAISSQHMLILREPSQYLDDHYDYFVEDMNSTNGTLVNDIGVDRQLLKHGDVIQVGKHKFIFDSGSGDLQETAIYLPE